MEKLVEHSQSHRKQRIVISVILAFLFGMAALSAYFWATRHTVDPYRLFTPIMIGSWVIWRAGSRFTYEADKKGLRIVKTSLFGGVTTYDIPYRDIDGIYYYEPKLMSIIKFRRTFRLHSALDGRPVWVIAYEAAGPRGKRENRRAYFKPSDVMLELLHEKMPSKVKVTEEDIFAQKVAREK